MTKWHETLVANIGLRTGGAALLGGGWFVAVRLHHMALVIPARDATGLMILLAAIVFFCGSAGGALLIVGPGLWEAVEVSERWRRLPPPGQAVSGSPVT
ncbi:MAG: hypothetical protein JHC57_16015 [Sphingopyxis sp.]|uniref:hypothetical protein n=1 Tax=Sphingopyxis sp. TaxID=1908224 RepID=UPI001A2BB845|nr:hypothetical protein [Sphingopyxis sp.]MBJ7501262.1 hypothetical protein [Sphingopyxis sp.]